MIYTKKLRLLTGTDLMKHSKAASHTSMGELDCNSNMMPGKMYLFIHFIHRGGFREIPLERCMK